MTGRYQQRFGHEFNAIGFTPDNTRAGLPLTETTIADRLKEAGYVTGLVGKWHLGSAPEHQPLSRGFDEFFGFLGGRSSYLKPNAIHSGTRQVHEDEYLTDAFAREAVSFIERHKKEPFFLYLAFSAVHTPLEAPNAILSQLSHIPDGRRRAHAAQLLSLDNAIGTVLDKLRSVGVDEDTLIIYHSDNGGEGLMNQSFNDPLRGIKLTTWEGGIRVPFVLSWKGKIPAGRTYDLPVIQLDVMPTVLAAAGLDAGMDVELDGVNLLPYVTGSKTGAPHPALFWRFGGQMAVRAGDWKLVKGLDDDRKDLYINMISDATTDGAKLFNLAEDIGEQIDLRHEHPEKVEELTAFWEEWNSTLPSPAWRIGSLAEKIRKRPRPDR